MKPEEVQDLIEQAAKAGAAVASLESQIDSARARRDELWKQLRAALPPTGQDDDTKEPQDAPSAATDSETTSAEILNYVKGCSGRTVTPKEISSVINIKGNAAAAYLSDFYRRGLVQKRGKGKYFYPQNTSGPTEVEPEV